MTSEPDFVRAKKKIADAKNWRGDVNVSLGDETVTFAHRLLTEGEFFEIKQALNLEAATDNSGNVGQTEAQERLLELQQKEELSEEEEEELSELAGEVAQEMDQIEDALGDEGYNILMDMGQRAIEPTDEDIEYVYDCNPQEMKQLMGVSSLPNPITKDAVAEELRGELVDMVKNQPYPITVNVGMQAFSETMSVLGNGLRS